MRLFDNWSIELLADRKLTLQLGDTGLRRYDEKLSRYYVKKSRYECKLRLCDAQQLTLKHAP
jgi:hypothetical protein